MWIKKFHFYKALYSLEMKIGMCCNTKNFYYDVVICNCFSEYMNIYISNRSIMLELEKQFRKHNIAYEEKQLPYLLRVNNVD